jgi:hypothetical protein
MCLEANPMSQTMREMLTVPGVLDDLACDRVDLLRDSSVTSLCEASCLC